MLISSLLVIFVSQNQTNMNRLYFSSLLRKHCEGSRLYLNHDLTLTQLAEAIGTNRTYLSAYFAQKGITFNIYINRLRIQHFERLYNKAVANYQPISAKFSSVGECIDSLRIQSRKIQNLRPHICTAPDLYIG